MAYSSMGTQWGKLRNEEGVYGNPVLNHPAILGLTRKLNASAAEVIISWVLQEGAIAIPRSSSPTHIRDNIQILKAVQTRKGCFVDNSGGCLREEPRVILSHADIMIIRSLDGIMNKQW